MAILKGKDWSIADKIDGNYGYEKSGGIVTGNWRIAIRREIRCLYTSYTLHLQQQQNYRGEV